MAGSEAAALSYAVGFPGTYQGAWERGTSLWSRWLISSPCGSPRRLSFTPPLAMVPQRTDRPPILARYLSTCASRLYRGRPVPSVQFLLNLLKSCDHPGAEEGSDAHFVPGRASLVMDQLRRIRQKTWRGLPLRHPRLTNLSYPTERIGMMAWPAGRLWSRPAARASPRCA